MWQQLYLVLKQPEVTSPTFPAVIPIAAGLAWLIWQQSLSVQGYKDREDKLDKKTHLLIELGLKVKFL